MILAFDQAELKLFFLDKGLAELWSEVFITAPTFYGQFMLATSISY